MSILGVQGSQGGGGNDFSGGSGVVSQEVWLGWVSQHSEALTGRGVNGRE